MHLRCWGCFWTGDWKGICAAAAFAPTPAGSFLYCSFFLWLTSAVAFAADEKSQQAASQWLALAKEQDLSGLMVGLAGVLAGTECSQGVRQQAGVQLKNCLTGQHDKITQLNIDQW